VPTATPLIIVALSVAVPAEVAVMTLPSDNTAPVPPAWGIDHNIVLFVASFGETIPDNVTDVPTLILFGTPRISSTGLMAALVTVIWKTCE
jgi:hypothetical protein